MRLTKRSERMMLLSCQCTLAESGPARERLIPTVDVGAYKWNHCCVENVPEVSDELVFDEASWHVTNVCVAAYVFVPYSATQEEHNGVVCVDDASRVR